MLGTSNCNFHFLYDMHRCCLDKQVSWFSRNIRTLGWENIDKLQYNVAAWNLRMGYQRLTYLHQSSTGKHPMAHVIWRRYSMPVCLVESSSLKSEDYSSNDHATESPKELLAQPLSRDEVKSHFHCIVSNLWSVRNLNSFLISPSRMYSDIEGIYLHFSHVCFNFLFLMGKARGLFSFPTIFVLFFSCYLEVRSLIFWDIAAPHLFPKVLAYLDLSKVTLLDNPLATSQAPIWHYGKFWDGN